MNGNDEQPDDDDTANPAAQPTDVLDNLEVSIFEASGDMDLATGAVGFIRRQVDEGKLDLNEVKSITVSMATICINSEDDDDASQ